MGKRRRTEIVEIANPAARLVTYSKRRKGLFNKASELCRLCGARAAVVVFSPAGKPCSFGDPSADEIIADYLGDRDGDVMPPIGLTEWAEWVDAEWEACSTEEDLESLVRKYEAVRDCARGKLMALEADFQVKVSAGDSHILSDEEIDAIFKSFKDQCPALSAVLTGGDRDDFLNSPENLAAGAGSAVMESTPACSDLENCVLDSDKLLNLLEDCDLDCNQDGFVTSPENLAAGAGSSVMESTPARSDIENCVFDPDEHLRPRDQDDLLTSPENLAAGAGSAVMESTPACSDLENCVLDSDKLLNLLEDCDLDCDQDGFVISPENLAAGAGSSVMESTPARPARSDLENCVFDPDELLNLLEDCDLNCHQDGFVTSPEDLAVGGGNSGVEPMLSDLEGYGYNTSDFLGLEDLVVL